MPFLARHLTLPLLARKLGKPLRELLTGRPGPLLQVEAVVWERWIDKQAEWGADGPLLAWQW